MYTGHDYILIGNALDKLRQLPDQHVNCIVTSPPYYNLRDYGVDGQIGLEQTLDEYVERMVTVFREARRLSPIDCRRCLQYSIYRLFHTIF